MANEVQILDGFRYEIEEAQLWNSEYGRATPIVILKLIDDDRGIEAHAYFPREGWEEFNRQINGGVLVPSPEALRKLGV
jgi:hypothetical protein